MKQHAGPHLGFLALVFTILFNLGLFFVVSFSAGQPHYPGPWEPTDIITAYFQGHPLDVQKCAFFQFGAAIPLGIFTAAITSRLRFLGITAAGPSIAAFGGWMTASHLAVSALSLWVMSLPAVTQDVGVLQALYYLVFAIGGVGYSVPLGLLIAGVAVSAGLSGLLPKWLCFIGIGIALCGELSFLSLLFPKLLPLIPLTRFPGFLWLIAAGFVLPKARQ